MDVWRVPGIPPVLETKSRSSTSLALVTSKDDLEDSASDNESDEERGGLSLVQKATSKVTKKFRSVTCIVLVLRFVLRLLKENKTSTRTYFYCFLSY